jgi:hypothetical protein
MQTIQYTCDWCRKAMTAERASQLRIEPVFLRPKPHAQQEEGEAESWLKTVSDRNSQAVQADICDSCFAELRGWMETRGMRR